MPVRGLTFIAIRPTSLRAGLELATANAALGGRARLFCQGEAVTALAPLRDPLDTEYVRCGLPTLAQMFEEALGLGVEIIACQSGMLVAGINAEAVDPRVGFGGPVSVLQTLGDDLLSSG